LQGMLLESGLAENQGKPSPLMKFTSSDESHERIGTACRRTLV